LEVSQVTGYSRIWIYQLVRRYNEHGPEGVGDLRHGNSGKKPLLTDEQQAQLWQVLQYPAPDGGLWNGRKVADWLSEITGHRISRHRGWEYLKQMTFRLRVPRPEHREGDPVEQNEWKKKLHTELEFLQSRYPDADIEVWSMDEHRLGLHPILRRVWTPIGEQPVASVQPKYEWLWLYGFVHPESGETYWWILPRVNTELFNRVLADFAREFSVSTNKRILLTVSCAGWHTSNNVVLPDGIHFFPMPAYSPELQPAERLWPLTNEVVANYSPHNLDELEELLVYRCQQLLEQHDLIRGLTCYHWWPMTRAA
jgi:transposase